MSAINCMPSGLVYRAGLTNCPTTNRLLASLAAYNVEAAVLTLILGHARVRRKLAFLTCNFKRRWNILGGCLTTVVHIAAMFVASITMRSNGFYPHIGMLFAFWTMRPRGAYFASVWYGLAMCFCGMDKHGENLYLWTLKDHVFEDTLLNLFSLPFAIWYITHRPSDLEVDECAANPAYLRFWNTFYAIAGVGGISLIIAAVMIHHWLNRKRRSDLKELSYSPLNAQGTYRLQIQDQRRQAERMSGVWKFTLIVGTFNMFAAAAAEWLIWSIFIVNAGTDFCPGRLLGQTVAWVVAIFLNAFIRPIVGGPPA